MKSSSLLLLSVAVAVGLTSCISIERTAPRTTVTREVTTTTPVRTTTTPVVERRVVTTLPRGYKTRTYLNTTYYYYDNVYYQSVPGGYTVVERPW